MAARVLLSVCAVLVAVSPAAAQRVAIQAGMIQLSDQQLASWVFGTARQPGSLEPVEHSLRAQLTFVELVGNLSETQRQKLELAGQGDIHRFFDRFNALQREFPTGPITQDEYQQLWQKVQPLQVRFRAGLHGPGSLFRKTIQTALNAEQLARYQELERTRNRQHYHAIVLAAVAMIDQRIPLTVEQRDELVTLTMEKTEPPPTYGQSYYQYYIALSQMSQIADDLKPLFLENEWRVLQQMFRLAEANARAQLRQAEQAALEDW